MVFQQHRHPSGPSIFFVGKWVARIVANIARRIMSKSDMDDILVKFLASITYGVLSIKTARSLMSIFRRLLRNHGGEPRKIVTDKLRS